MSNRADRLLRQEPLTLSAEEAAVKANRLAVSVDQKTLLEGDAALAALNAIRGNTHSILRLCLGIGGGITWTTPSLPWFVPMDYNPIQVVDGSYSCKNYPGGYRVKPTSPRMLEDHLELLLEDTPDVAAPVVLESVFTPDIHHRGSGDNTVLRNIHQFFKDYLFPTMPHHTVVDGEGCLTISLAFEDYVYDNSTGGVFQTFFQCLEDHSRGSQRGIPYQLNQRWIIGDNASDGGRQLSKAHHCKVLPQDEAPRLEDVAAFFQISTEQVRMAIGRYFDLINSLSVHRGTFEDKLPSAVISL